MNNTELKAIIENAPEGATHVDSDGDYWAIENYKWRIFTCGISDCFEDVVNPQSLSDIRTMLTQAEENERLKNKLKFAEDIVTNFSRLIDIANCSIYVTQFESIVDEELEHDGGYVVQQAKDYIEDYLTPPEGK